MVDPAADDVTARRELETLRADVLYVLSQRDADRRFAAAVAVRAHLPPAAGLGQIDDEAQRTRTACDDALQTMIEAKGGTRAMAARWIERLRPRGAANGILATGADLTVGPAPLPGTVDLGSWRRPVLVAGSALATAAAALMFLPSDNVTRSGEPMVTAPEHAGESASVADSSVERAATDSGVTQRPSDRSVGTTTSTTTPTTTTVGRSITVIVSDRTAGDADQFVVDQRPSVGGIEAAAVRPTATATPATVTPPTVTPPTVTPPTVVVATFPEPPAPPAAPNTSAPTVIVSAPAVTAVAPTPVAIDEPLSPREEARLEREAAEAQKQRDRDDDDRDDDDRDDDDRDDDD